jgi:hypothetical protein
MNAYGAGPGRDGPMGLESMIETIRFSRSNCALDNGAPTPYFDELIGYLEELRELRTIRGVA